MSRAIERLKKQWMPSRIEVCGEEYFIRPMTLGEISRMEKLPNELKTAFAIGCILFEDAGGEPALPRVDGETDEQRSQRIQIELCDSTFIPRMTELVQASNDLQTVKKAETVLKN